MDLLDLISAASKLLNAVSAFSAHAKLGDLSGEQFCTKCDIAAECTQRLMSIHTAQSLTRVGNGQINITRFAKSVQRAESCFAGLGTEIDQTDNALAVTSLCEWHEVIDGLVDDLECLEADFLTAELSERAQEKGEQLEQYFTDRNETSAQFLSFASSILGQGSFGFTYRMRCDFDKKTYAVKRVDLQRLALMGVPREQLENECALMRSLAHPNIARYFLTFYSRKVEKINIVSELIEATSLAQKVDAALASNEAEITEWARQMASALSCMHGQGVLHRDLRLDNVLLSARSRVKICDIKPACAVGFSAAFGRPDTELDVYSSYEKTHDMTYDGRDDVYAVGIILLSLLLRARYFIAPYVFTGGVLKSG
jgi:hypothetical protein